MIRERRRQTDRHWSGQTVETGPCSYDMQISIILLMTVLPVCFFLALKLYDSSVFACVQTIEEAGSWTGEI